MNILYLKIRSRLDLFTCYATPSSSSWIRWIFGVSVKVVMHLASTGIHTGPIFDWLLKDTRVLAPSQASYLAWIWISLQELKGKGHSLYSLCANPSRSLLKLLRRQLERWKIFSPSFVLFLRHSFLEFLAMESKEERMKGGRKKPALQRGQWEEAIVHTHILNPFLNFVAQKPTPFSCQLLIRITPHQIRLHLI